MDHRDVARYWNANADVWTRLTRDGYDVYRDLLNTPAFFDQLPNVSGLSGLDIGCGEGHNTRLLSDTGARVTAIDVSDVFIHHAKRAEIARPRDIDYLLASGVELPFAEASFDFVVGFMSFMDIPEVDRVLAETCRVLKPGGFVQFSIEHPCYTTPHRRRVRNHDGVTFALEVGDYFRETDGEIAEWLFSAAPPDVRRDLTPFRVPKFTRTISQWLNLVVDAGLQIERVMEPRPDKSAIARYPRLQGADVVAFFLHLRARRPALRCLT